MFFVSTQSVTCGLKGLPIGHPLLHWFLYLWLPRVLGRPAGWGMLLARPLYVHTLGAP